MRSDQMCSRRRRLQEPMNVLLEDAIGVGHSFVLPQVLDPRLDEKRFQKSTGFGGILEHAPRVGAVPPTATHLIAAQTRRE